MYKDVTVEIDGDVVEYENVLDIDQTSFGAFIGGLSGSNGKAKKEDKIVMHEVTGSVFVLAIWGTDKDGNYWDIIGLYKKGSWGTTEDGGILYSVEERLA